jgi:NAD(P)-dependent dehydrogenase (short-subunit alcohol dehydrogenase family)
LLRLVCFNRRVRGPEKTLRGLDPSWLAQVYAVNAIGAALVAKHLQPIMPTSGRGVFAALSARVGSMSDNRLGGWYGYRASKAALNMLIRNLAIEERRRNDRTIVVALHPGTVNTNLSRPFQGNLPPPKLFSTERAALQLLFVIEELTVQDSGKYSTLKVKKFRSSHQTLQGSLASHIGCSGNAINLRRVERPLCGAPRLPDGSSLIIDV